MSSVQYPTSFLKYGTGPVVWLAFHGIGQDAACFAPFGERLTDSRTIYSIELPFHGQNQNTDWPPAITNSDWEMLVARFLLANGIARFSVAGFSMGGRFALVTAQAFAARIDEVLLLAPDGITNDPWFALATGTQAGRWLLRLFLKNTRLFLALGRGLVQLGLLNASLLRFVQATMQTPAQRTQIYHSWTAFRSVGVPIGTFARTMRQHDVRVRLFLGQFDAVLPRSYTKPLEKALPNCEVTVLPTGHTSLVRRVAAQF